MSTGEIKVWKLTPDQVADYVPGMDLGHPNEVIKPERDNISFLGKIEEKKARQKRSVESRDKGKVVISQDLYLKHRKSGMRDKEIALKYGIKPGTLAHYKSLWRKQDAK